MAYQEEIRGEAEFDDVVLGSKIPVVVDFWAPWCGPCRMLAPMLEELAAEFEGHVRFVKVNIDENDALAARYGIRSIPTLIPFKDGKVVVFIVGFKPRDELRAKIAALLE